MDVYRITSPAHAVLDGVGAASSDSARWNSKGRYIVYAAEHYATALLEKAAQLNAIRIPRSLSEAVSSWPDFAKRAKVRQPEIARVQEHHLLLAR